MREGDPSTEGPTGPAIPVPLDEPPEDHFPLYDRIVLRHGTEIQKRRIPGTQY